MTGSFRRACRWEERPSSEPGRRFKEIYVVPTGFQNGLEEVLIVVKGEHQPIPERSESAVVEQHLSSGPAESGGDSRANAQCSVDRR